MRKKILIIISIILSSLFVFNCKSKVKKIDFKFNDKNCVIGNESKVKKNRYIGSVKSISNKAKIISLGIKPSMKLISFANTNEWKFSKKIKNIEDLTKNKGTCLAIDFKSEGANIEAVKIEVLPPYAPPAKQLINLKQLLAIIGPAPGVKKGVTLVDSRPKGKWIQGTIPGSINIPLGVLKKGKGFSMLPKDKSKTVIFFCGGFHCKLAPFSGRLAAKKGYKNVKVFWAGYPGWKKASMPGVVKTAYIKKMQKKKMPLILIDLRKDAAKEHIPGAYAVNEKNLNSIKAMMPKNKKAKKKAPVIVYGPKAYNSAKTIASWGMKNVTVLQGGIAAYKKAGGKTDSGKLLKKINFILKLAPGETTAEQFYSLIKNGLPKDLVIVDVRGNSEVSADLGIMILGGINIPLQELKSKAGNLDKSKRYFTFCATGIRAGLGRDILADYGFKKAFFVNAPISNPDGGLGIGKKIKINVNELSKITGKKIKKTKTKKKVGMKKIEGC